MFTLVEPVLSSREKVSCSKTQHCTAGWIQTHDLLVLSPAQVGTSNNYGEQFFSQVEAFSWVETVLNSENKML